MRLRFGVSATMNNSSTNFYTALYIFVTSDINKHRNIFENFYRTTLANNISSPSYPQTPTVLASALADDPRFYPFLMMTI